MKHLLSTFFLLATFVTAQANCDSCQVTAVLSYNFNWDCSVTLTDNSYADSCTTIYESRLYLGDGSPFIYSYSGYDTTHAYNQGNYTACLVTYAQNISWDSTGWDTTYCADTSCVSFSVPICESPWRLKQNDMQDEFSIFPNPATQQTNIRFSEGTNRIRIVNLKGQVVFDQANPSKVILLDIRKYQKGIYLVEEYKPNSKEVKKLIIQ